ncbi:MAG: uroporphyrinogen-III synthase [Methylobacterium frigidaeris]
MTGSGAAEGAWRIWVARPRPAGERSAARLTTLGHAPLLAPVLDLAPGREPPPQGVFAGLILTSANAAGPLAASGLAPGAPVYCVGARTAAAARAAGLAPVREAGGDAAALAALVAAELPPGTRLLHAAGRERKPEPEASLTAAGYRLAVWTAYAARALTELPEAVAAALGEGRLDAALHYSRRSAATALGLARAAGREAAFGRLVHACLSADVAAPLVAAGVPSHVVAARPDEDALLETLLEALFSRRRGMSAAGLVSRPGGQRC